MYEQAHTYCQFGATRDELAERGDFRDAVRSGRVAVDARAARRNWEDEWRIQEKLALRKRCYL